MRLTEAEWSVLSVLWSGERFALGEVTEALKAEKKWSRNTVHTYLTRMEAKGLVRIDRTAEKPYAAAIAREDCARQERRDLLQRVYDGATGDLVAAFLQEADMSQKEIARLKKLLDEMEV